MLRLLLTVVCIALLAAQAQAQCRGGQCSTPAAACVGGSCNLQAAPAVAPLPVAAVPVAPSASRSVAVARTRVGGPLAGVATRRAQRATERAIRANSRSRAVVRTRAVSANEPVRHDFVAAAEAVAPVQQVAVAVPVVAGPVAVATAVVQ